MFLFFLIVTISFVTFAIISPAGYNCELNVNLKGAQLAGKGTLWLITHTGPMIYNKPGKKTNVVTEKKPLTDVSSNLNLSPLSVSLYKLAIKM